MLFPHHLTPPRSGKMHTPSLGYWLPFTITNNAPFHGLSREIFPRLRPPPPKKKKKKCSIKISPFPKMETRMRPPYAFECGSGIILLWAKFYRQLHYLHLIIIIYHHFISMTSVFNQTCPIFYINCHYTAVPYGYILNDESLLKCQHR